MKTNRLVGFWDPNPPGAHSGVWDRLYYLMETAQGFPRAEDCVDWSWNKRERERILSYVEDLSFRRMSYCGYSTCRICGKYDNGSADYSDGIWMWPEGFGHYIREHGVRPPADFVQHVLSTRR